MGKAGSLVILSFFIVSLLSSSGFAAIPDNVPFSDETQYVQEVVEQRKWEYLGEAWQELLLKNKFIGRANEVFTKMNTLFVVLFARDYSFSFEMLFVFLLWLFTLLSISQYNFFYVFNFSDYSSSPNKTLNFVITLLLTSLLAHIQIFNYVSKAMFKFMFYKSSPWWSLITFIFLMVLLAVYLYINRLFGKMFGKSKEKTEREKLERRVSNQEAFNQTLTTQAGTYRIS